MLAHVRVPAADAELAADALWQAGAHAVEERRLADDVAVLVADVEPPAHLLREGWTVTVEAVVDDGLDAWRAHAHAWRAGRFVVQPPWCPPLADVGPDDVVLLVDPGRAFGSGSHVTTRMALVALADHVRAGDHVLDLGCGSGVLGIAAALIGARVTAIDVDGDALRATAQNAARNGVADAVDVRAAGVDVVADRLDVVVANVPRAVLQEAAASLSRHATLVVSGFLERDVDDVRTLLSAWTSKRIDVDDGWACLVLTPSS